MCVQGCTLNTMFPNGSRWSAAHTAPVEKIIGARLPLLHYRSACQARTKSSESGPVLSGIEENRLSLVGVAASSRIIIKVVIPAKVD